MKKFEFELSGLAGVGICIMIGLMVLGNCVGDGIEKMADKDRYVTVKGLAEREVMADKVIWPLPYYCLGNNLEELYDRVEKDKNIILEFLKENGINSNEIVMSAPIVTDREAQMYAPENIKISLPGRERHNRHFVAGRESYSPNGQPSPANEKRHSH